MNCDLTVEQRIAFAAGESTEVGEHILTCDECQLFLAELWGETLSRDLTPQVMRALELEQFVLDVTKLGGSVLARFAQAMAVYLLGKRASESDNHD